MKFCSDFDPDKNNHSYHQLSFYYVPYTEHTLPPLILPEPHEGIFSAPPPPFCKETEAQKSRVFCLRSHSSQWQMQGPETVLPILSKGEDTVSLLLHPENIRLPCPWPLCTFNLHFAAGCFRADEVSSLPWLCTKSGGRKAARCEKD